MKRNDAILLLLPLGLAAAAWSQTAIDLRTQTKDVDFSSASSTKPIKTGTSLPGTCTSGAVFLNLAATAGQNIYLCTAANTWTQVQGGSGSSGSGASMFQQLGDFALTYSGTAGTVGASCSPATPCIAAVGYGGYSFTSAATVTASGSGNDTYYVHVNSGGTLMVGYGGSTAPVCSACTVIGGVTSYPAGVAAIGRFTVSGGQIVASVSDRAVIAGPPTLVAGSNVTISTAGNTVTISSTGGSSSLPSTVVQTNQSNAYTAGTQDFRSASHTLPMATGAVSAKPGTCTVGEQYFATDAAAGQNLYFCAGTNAWTQISAGSGGSGFDPTNWAGYDSGRISFFNVYNDGQMYTGNVWNTSSCGGNGGDGVLPPAGYVEGIQYKPTSAGGLCPIYSPSEPYTGFSDFASGSSPLPWQMQVEYRIPSLSAAGSFYAGILQNPTAALSSASGVILLFTLGSSPAFTLEILNAGSVVSSSLLSATPDNNYHYLYIGNGGTANSVRGCIGSSCTTITGTIPPTSGGYWWFVLNTVGSGSTQPSMALSEAEFTILGGRSKN